MKAFLEVARATSPWEGDVDVTMAAAGAEFAPEPEEAAVADTSPRVSSFSPVMKKTMIPMEEDAVLDCEGALSIP
jgi:hypothetical protein